MQTQEKKSDQQSRFDRYLPCIFRRLQDSAPMNNQREEFLLDTLEDLKQDVLHNLEMLLNSRSHIAEEELPEDLRNSVLGYGLYDFCGATGGGETEERLLSAIRAQIHAFEPRLEKETLKVEIVKEDSTPRELIILISGKLLVRPLPVEFRVLGAVDLEQGTAVIKTEKA